MARADASEAKKAASKKYNSQNMRNLAFTYQKSDPIFEQMDEAANLYDLPKSVIAKDALHRWLENSDEYAFELKAKRGEIEEIEEIEDPAKE